MAQVVGQPESQPPLSSNLLTGSGLFLFGMNQEMGDVLARDCKVRIRIIVMNVLCFGDI